MEIRPIALDAAPPSDVSYIRGQYPIGIGCGFSRVGYRIVSSNCLNVTEHRHCSGAHFELPLRRTLVLTGMRPGLRSS